MCSYIFVSMAYGMMMENAGFAWYYSLLTSLTVYTGAFQFVLITFLSSGASIVTIAVTALLMNSRQSFYSLSFLETFRKMGRKKLYMIHTMTDETYAVNCTIEDSDKIFNTNFHGVFFGSQAAAKAFIAHDTKGVIVNTSSINFRCVTPNTTCYAASKGAISMFTRGIAVELSKYGIRANCFAPGTTNTDMVGESARERFPHYTAKRLVIPRMAKPEEQAAVALFLASDDASYMSGETVFNVGGWGIF